MKVDKIIPCICCNNGDIEQSIYYGMPILKVEKSQWYTPICPKCGRGGIFEYKSPYLALKAWNKMQEDLRRMNEPIFLIEKEQEDENE